MFPCPICDVKLNSVEQKKAHCRGKNHVKRMAARDKALELGTDFDSTPDYCEVCNVPLTSKMTAIDHFKGKMHQKKVKTSEDLRQGFQHYCDVCDVKLQSLKVSEAHFSGKQHRKRERKNFTRGKEKHPPNERKPRPAKAEKTFVNSPSSFTGKSGQPANSASTWESLNCDNHSDSKDPLSEFRSILSGKSPDTPSSPSHTKKPYFSFDNADISQHSTFHKSTPNSDSLLPEHFNTTKELSPAKGGSQKPKAPTRRNSRAHNGSNGGTQRKQQCLPAALDESFKIPKPMLWEPRANMPSYMNSTNELIYPEQIAAKTNTKDGNISVDCGHEMLSPFPRVLHALAQTIYPISSGDISRKIGCITLSEVNTALVHLERCKMVTKSGHSPVLWALSPHLRKHNVPSETNGQIYPQNFTSRSDTYPKDSLMESCYYSNINDAYLVETGGVSQAFSTKAFPSAILSSSSTNLVTTMPTFTSHAIETSQVFESNLINLLQQNGPISTSEILKKLNLPDEATLVCILNKLLERRVITTDSEIPQRWRLSSATRFNSVGVIGEERKRKSPVQNNLIANEQFCESTPSPSDQSGLSETILNGFGEPERRRSLPKRENGFDKDGEKDFWPNFNGSVLNGNGILEQAKPELLNPYFHEGQDIVKASSHDQAKSIELTSLSSLRSPVSPVAPLQTETSQFLDDLTETSANNYQKELYELAMQEDVVCYLPTGTGQGVVMASVIRHMLILNPTKQALVVVEDTITALDQARCLRKELGCKTKRKKLNVALYSGQLKQSNGKTQVVVVTSSSCLRLLNCGVLSWRDVCLLVFDKADMCTNDRPSHQIVRDYYMKAKSDFRDLHVPKLLGFLDCSAADGDLEKTVKKFHAVLRNMGDVFLAGVSQFKEELEESKSEAMFVCVPANLTKEEERIFRVIHNYLILVFENLAAQWQPFNSYRELFELAFQRYPINGEAFAKLVRLTGQPLEKRLPVSCLKTWRHYLAVCEVLLALVECGEELAMDLLANLKREAFGFAWASNAGLPANELSLHLLTTVPQKKQQWGYNLLGSGLRELIEQLMIIQWENARVSSERPLALVIVKLGKTGKTLASYLARHPELTKRNVKTTFVDGLRSSHQKAVISAIKRRQYQVIVSTDDVEDSLDLPPCELVVLLDQPTTLSALVCLRKRQGANMVAICREPDGEKNLKELLRQEELVEKAVDYIRGVGSG